MDDQEISVIANNIEQESSEDILEIASELIYLVNDSVKVAAAKRLKSKSRSKYHTDRILELNASTFLDQILQRDMFRVTSRMDTL